MNRLKKVADSEKWFVTNKQVDGSYNHPFDSKEDAIKFVSEFLGREIDPNTTDTEWYDNYGGVLYLEKGNSKNCANCGKEDKVNKIKNVDLCDNCWDDYECGNIDIIDGKPVETEESKKWKEK